MVEHLNTLCDDFSDLFFDTHRKVQDRVTSGIRWLWVRAPLLEPRSGIAQLAEHRNWSLTDDFSGAYCDSHEHSLEGADKGYFWISGFESQRTSDFPNGDCIAVRL